MVPSFLSLPSELRNAIVRYALSSPSPLVYRYATPHHTFGVLCSDTSTTDTPDRVIELNQLKNVSRQLRTETEGLELQCNDLVFCRDVRRPRAHDDASRQAYSRDIKEILDSISLPSDEEKPVDAAIRFLQHIPLYRFSWLQTITIKPLRNETSMPIFEEYNGLCAFSQMGSLARIARCPGLAVRYILPGLTSRDPDYTVRFIGECLIVRSWVRGLQELDDVLLPAHIAQAQPKVQQHSVAKATAVQHPNFRMFPGDTVDESWIRRAVEDIYEEQMSARVLQLWIYYALKWIAEGF